MQQIPIYVTRPTATGKTGQIYMGSRMYQIVAHLLTFNLLLWGLVGIVAAVSYLVEVVK